MAQYSALPEYNMILCCPEPLKTSVKTIQYHSSTYSFVDDAVWLEFTLNSYSFSEWSNKVFQICCQTFCVEAGNDPLLSMTTVTNHDTSKHRLAPVTEEKSVTKALRTLHRKEVLEIKATTANVITQPNARYVIGRSKTNLSSVSNQNSSY